MTNINTNSLKPNPALGERIIAEDVVISNDTRYTGCNNNTLVVGPSGCGKTGSYVINHLLKPSSSLIVSDTKGLLRNKYEKHLKSLGYSVYCLDFVNPAKSNCAYNPLRFIRQKKDGTYNEKDIRSIAATLCPVSMESRDPFWPISAQRYITMLIGYVLCALTDDSHTLSQVCQVHRSIISGPGWDIIAQFCAINPNSLCAKLFRQMSNIREADKTYACIMEFANNALQDFEISDFAPLFEKKNCFDFKTLGRKKSVLFLNVSDNDPAFDSVMHLLHTQLLQALFDEADSRNDGRLKVPTRLILDDFAASCKIDGFDRIISVVRSRDIYIDIILQSLSQLSATYGHYPAKTIINNCDTVLCFGGTRDTETIVFLSTFLNKPTSSILALDRSRAILIHGSKAGVVNKLKPYSMDALMLNGGTTGEQYSTNGLPK